MSRLQVIFLLCFIAATHCVAPPSPPPAPFALNTLNTTGYGPPWTDTIMSYPADFVLCDGPYALCFYSNCSERTELSAWAPGIPMADCPCSKHHGPYLVMVNAILDEATWRATRQRCPLGILSCPRPNIAPVCSRINNNSLFQDAAGLETATLVSAYSPYNVTRNLGTTDCTGHPGPYAGCMTAPCTATSDGASCQCPVATGPYQIGGRNKDCAGIPSASYAVPYQPGDWSLLPHNCDSSLQVCYQGSLEAVRSVKDEDPISCVGKNATMIAQMQCSEAGYGTHVGKDPVYREVDIYVRHPKIAPTDFIERCESRFKNYNLAGKGLSALVITTSHGVLGPENCTSCKGTGVASPEFTAPFYIFQDAGVNVTLASILGGTIPVDSEARYMTHWDTRFWSDAAAVELALDSPSIESLDLSSYDLVYMAGGWGAAWDLGTSKTLADGVSAAAAAGRVLGSVCHGALGFVQATTPDGAALVKGRNMTAVTNRQIEQLGIASITPMHPETELRKLGANYLAQHGIVTDLDQSMVVVDGRLVTGQNQNSACETAQRMLDQVA